MNDASDASVPTPDDLQLADHLLPIDTLLRQLSDLELPDCPDGLCDRTLKRCGMELAP